MMMDVFGWILGITLTVMGCVAIYVFFEVVRIAFKELDGRK